MLEYLQFENMKENRRRDKHKHSRRKSALASGMLLCMLGALAFGSAGCGRMEEADAGREETEMNQENEKVQSESVLLHYILPEGYEYRYIGDVHPFYDDKSGEWYMYYLDTSGQFRSKLLTSKDGISWEPVELTSKSSMANYGVLGLVRAEGKYYSYYGDYYANVSEDLINWEYAGESFRAFQDKEQFPGGCRDPFVAYDEATDRFYSVAINYVKRVPGEGIFDANLAIGRTASASLEDWCMEAKPVFAQVSDNHDPECPQLIQIGGRWYVFTSFYGYSRHGVGRLAYLVGDEGLDPYSVDWTTKEVHYLTSEDVCAAQVAQKGDSFYVFGWIPKQYDAGFWGGHISLPTEVYQLEDGRLGARMSQDTTQLIRGERYLERNEASEIGAEETVCFSLERRSDIVVDFLLNGEKLTLDYADKKLEIEIVKKEGESAARVVFNHMTLSEIELDDEQLKLQGTLRIISEADMLEIYINDRYYLPARIGVKLGDEEVTLHSDDAVICSIEAYHLKTAQEVKNGN